MERASLNLVRVCSRSEIQPGAARRVKLDGMAPLAVFLADDEIFVIDDTCTHGLASLADGWIDGDVVECPLHGGCFSIRTGEALSFPAVQPVRSYKEHEIGDDIFIDPD
jgi:nitrite reductase/ring-hydroxylating ferredoxin subunit